MQHFPPQCSKSLINPVNQGRTRIGRSINQNFADHDSALFVFERGAALAKADIKHLKIVATGDL
jgi:hypothetical protein